MANFIQRLLHALNSQRRAIGERVRQGVHRRVQFRRRHQMREVADAEQFFCPQLFRSQEQALGIVETQAGDITLKPGRVVMHAKPGGRHEHFHPRHANAEIRRQREIRGTAINAALQAANGRHAHRFKPVRHGFEARRAGGSFLVFCEASQMEASAEGRATRGQDQHAERRVGIHLFQIIHDADDIAGLDPVAVAGAMQPDGGAAAFNFQAGRIKASVFGHGVPLMPGQFPRFQRAAPLPG